MKVENKREKLKEVIDSLTELYEDEEVEINSVGFSLHSSTCKHGEKLDYGATNFENYVIVWER